MIIIVTWCFRTSNSQAKGHLCTYTKGSRKLPEAPFYCFYRVSIVPFTIGSAVFKTTIDATGRGLKSWPTHTWDWQKIYKIFPSNSYCYSSVVKFLWWWVLKKQDVGQKPRYSKEIIKEIKMILRLSLCTVKAVQAK